MSLYQDIPQVARKEALGIKDIPRGPPLKGAYV